MSELGFNVWGAVAGVIGTVTLFPALACWLYCRMPTNKLRILDHLLKETESAFDLAVKTGLLHSGNGLHRFNVKLWSIQFRADDLRGEVYAIRSWSAEVSSWWRGTSATIRVLCEELKDMQVKLALNSSRERRALAATGYLNRLATSASDVKGPFMHSFRPPGLEVSAEPTSSDETGMSRCRLNPPSYDSGLPKHHIPSTSHSAFCALPHCSRVFHAVASSAPELDGSAVFGPRSSQPHVGNVTGHALDPQVSERDLRHLLSYMAAYRVEEQHDDSRRQRVVRKELLKRFGDQLSNAPVSRPSSIEPLLSDTPAGGSRPRTIKQVVRGQLRRGFRPHVILVSTVGKSRRGDLHPSIHGLSPGTESEGDDWSEE